MGIFCCYNKHLLYLYIYNGSKMKCIFKKSTYRRALNIGCTVKDLMYLWKVNGSLDCNIVL